MRPKIFEMLFNDDRMFVLELSPVTTRPLTSDEPVRNEWVVITCRNVLGYPPFRSDTFQLERKRSPSIRRLSFPPRESVSAISRQHRSQLWTSIRSGLWQKASTTRCSTRVRHVSLGPNHRLKLDCLLPSASRPSIRSGLAD